MNEKFNNERGEAEFIIENYEFIVRLASACIRKQNKNFKSLTLLNIQSEFTASIAILKFE